MNKTVEPIKKNGRYTGYFEVIDMNDTNTVGTTGKTVEQIACDWENSTMTKKEIVKHFVEICKMDEVLIAREREETERWKRDVLTLQKQNNLVWEKYSALKSLFDVRQKEHDALVRELKKVLGE